MNKRRTLRRCACGTLPVMRSWRGLFDHRNKHFRVECPRCGRCGWAEPERRLARNRWNQLYFDISLERIKHLWRSCHWHDPRKGVEL